MSAYELAHRYSKLFISEPIYLPSDIVISLHQLEADRNLTRILRSKSPSNPFTSAGDLVEAYTRKPLKTSGTWTSPHPANDYDMKSGTVAVPKMRKRNMKAVVEDCGMQ